MNDASNPVSSIVAGGRDLYAEGVRLPLVTVLLINRNYEAFIGDTVDSIRNQHYRNFECLVIDNGSDDNSIEAATRHFAGDARFKIISLGENLGQLGATVRIFDQINGEFVVVVDADDVLFSDFLATHIQTHLSLVEAVAATSSNLVETDAAARILVGRRLGFGSGYEPDPGVFCSQHLVPRISSIDDEQYDHLCRAVAIVPHWNFRWVWSPGSSNVYRKSAMALVLPDPAKIVGHASCDGYFLPALNMLAGSALIFRQLSMYRIHGRNAFSAMPTLHAMQTKRPRPEIFSNRVRVLHTFVSRAASTDWILAGDRFWPTLDVLAPIDNLTVQQFWTQQPVLDHLAGCWGDLVNVFGLQRLLTELHRRLPIGNLIRLARTVSLPLAGYGMIVKLQMTSFLHKWISRLMRSTKVCL